MVLLMEGEIPAGVQGSPCCVGSSGGQARTKATIQMGRIVLSSYMR